MLTHGYTDSGAEQVQRWAPTARVVKVFNCTGRENIEHSGYPAGQAMMLACGEHAAAVEIAIQLASDIGFAACHRRQAAASVRDAPGRRWWSLGSRQLGLDSRRRPPAW